MELQEEQIEEEIDSNFLCCNKCGCTNIGIIKKGFSGRNSVRGFLLGSLIGGIIVFLAGLTNDSFIFYLAICFSSCFPLLGFFYGTVEMNDVYNICMRCGEKILIKKAG
jgi:hypothetical protein